jgi:Tfp pilus assembly protein PilF
LNYGSARKALIDLDIAVKLEPQDSLYPSTRAFCFLQLGKLQEALNDCNMVLERDRMYKSALLTRCSVYRAMGEQDKANADAELLEEIY